MTFVEPNFDPRRVVAQPLYAMESNYEVHRTYCLDNHEEAQLDTAVVDVHILHRVTQPANDGLVFDFSTIEGVMLLHALQQELLTKERPDDEQIYPNKYPLVGDWQYRWHLYNDSWDYRFFEVLCPNDTNDLLKIEWTPPVWLRVLADLEELCHQRKPTLKLPDDYRPPYLTVPTLTLPQHDIDHSLQEQLWLPRRS